jgi:hypothetical protein
MTRPFRTRPTPLGVDLEEAHRRGVAAGTAGMQDPALAGLRLTGPAVATLAEAAISSATPFLRAPLLGRISQALLLHPAGGGECPTCREPVPCETARALR